VSLDQKTFEALKTRGPVFVALDEDATIDPQPPASSRELNLERGLEANDAAQAPAEQEPAATIEQQPAGAQLPDVAQSETGDDAQSTDYPPGRMSLGRKLSSANSDAAAATSWWNELVEAVTGK
jgi:hypothetical protein